MPYEQSSTEVRPQSDMNNKEDNQLYKAPWFKPRWMATGKLRYLALFFMILGLAAVVVGIVATVIEALTATAFLDRTIREVILFGGLGLTIFVVAAHLVHIASRQISDVPELEEGAQSLGETEDVITFKDKIFAAKQPSNQAGMTYANYHGFTPNAKGNTDSMGEDTLFEQIMVNSDLEDDDLSSPADIISIGNNDLVDGDASLPPADPIQPPSPAG